MIIKLLNTQYLTISFEMEVNEWQNIYRAAKRQFWFGWITHLFTLKGVNNTLIEKGHPGDWSPANCCSVRQTFPQAVRKPSSESSDSE